MEKSIILTAGTRIPLREGIFSRGGKAFDIQLWDLDPKSPRALKPGNHRGSTKEKVPRRGCHRADAMKEGATEMAA